MDEKAIEEAVEGRRDLRDLTTEERAEANRRIDEAIREHANRISFGEELRRHGQ